MYLIWEKYTSKEQEVLRYLQKMMTNDISKINIGAAQYTACVMKMAVRLMIYLSINLKKMIIYLLSMHLILKKIIMA